MNQQPWEFIVVTDQDLIKKLAKYKYDHNMQGFIASKVPRGEAENRWQELRETPSRIQWPSP